MLIDLGLGMALTRVAGEPDRLVVRQGQGGGRIMEMPLKAETVYRALRAKAGKPLEDE